MAMKWTYDDVAFFEKTGAISDIFRLLKLGLEADTAIGYFDWESLDDLRDFCVRHPEYHIVSALGDGFYLNRFDGRAFLFKLADGDPDPQLALNAKWRLFEKFPEVMNLFKARRWRA